jgi:hypothetical protein
LSIRNPRAIVRLAAGLFCPQRPLLKLGVNGYSPAVLHKIVGTAGQVKSPTLAAPVLKLVGEFALSGRPGKRLAETIGTAMAGQRAQATQDYVQHRRQPATAPAPALVSIALEGGRVLTRATGQGVGVQQQQWKEDKVACLLTREGATFAAGPHPEPPPCFRDAPTVDQRVRDLQAHHGPRQQNELPQLAEVRLGKETMPAATPAATPEVVGPKQPAWPPKRTKAARTCVATMQGCAAFGKMAAAAA